MPELRQRMTMHLNGGRTYSVLQYEILADGKPTGIQRVRRTNGSPKYLIEVDTFVDANGEEFDVLATKGVGMTAWLEAHIKPEA